MTGNIRDYGEAWQDKMVEIWKDRLELAGAVDTRSLYNSVRKGALSAASDGMSIGFQFLTYGIYQDLGVGPEFTRGGREGDGTLPFLDPAYRAAHRLDVRRKVGPVWGGRLTSGHPRKPRPWFNTSWYISVRVLKDHMARIVGDTFAGIFDNLTDKERR